MASPASRFLPAAGLLLLMAGCAAPVEEPTATPAASAPPASLPPLPALPEITFDPLGPGTTPTTVPPALGYPTANPYPTTDPYPTVSPTRATRTVPPATTTASPAPLTKSPTPTPSRAEKCRGKPTAAQILALVRDVPGVPDTGLEVSAGPFCSGDWSFSTVTLAGRTAEPLQVVAIGAADTPALVTAGADVCSNRVQQQAPPSIRVLACGF